MPARRFILASTLLALLVALVVPPVDLPETVYNESDSPFVALRVAAVHPDHVGAQQAVLAGPIAIWVHDVVTEWRVFTPAPPTSVVPLPAAQEVLLC